MIGSLEADVLIALRTLGSGPARAVRAEIGRTGRPLAYTTVATCLTRLHRKGLVRRHSENCRGGERYVYEPVDVERTYLTNILKAVVGLFGPAGVVHLGEELAKLKPEEELELRRRLKL